MRFPLSFHLPVLALVLTMPGLAAQAPAGYRSHPPTRPLPVPSDRPLPAVGVRFVDAGKGNDQHDGSKEKPWKTIAHGLKQLKPGDTLCLRGGTYYGTVTVAVSGTAEKPLTIRAHPGELVVLDGGFREFFDDPANAWEPFPQGAKGEYRSTKTYAFGGGFANFGDSLVPLHRYLTFADLRSANEFYRPELNNRADDPTGIYCGPGVRRDPETGRIHIRLAHTQLAGLGEKGYRGETDPRKLPLVIAGHEATLRIEGARHLRLQDLIVRGAEQSAVRIAEDAEDTAHDADDIELDGLTLYGSREALRVSRTRNLRVLHCALRGHAAPWHSRFHHKNRAGAGYLVMAAARSLELAHCDCTDHHDFLQHYFVEDLRFHHNFVDNFNDDAVEPGPKKERGQAFVYQNYFSRCLNPFTAHGGKQPIAVKGEEGSGVYICRNVLDFRQGTYKAPPAKPDPSGAFLNEPTVCLGHDHGSPTWPNYYFYHNTCLLPGDAMRGYYAMSWGSHTHGTTRRAFNNIFLQVKGLPGLNLAAVAPEDDFQGDGNLLWGIQDGPGHGGDFFGKYRRSSLFEQSKKRYPPGWAAHDVFADPKLKRLTAEGPLDVRLQDGSPAVDAGVAVPADWFDPLRKLDKGKPDMGALPLAAEMFPAGRASRGQ